MMTNPNVFSALAYIRSTDNPLHVLCNYICYAMSKIHKPNLAAEEILDAVGAEFGIKLSTYVFEACRKQLIHSGRIKNNSGSFTLADIGFDVDQFEKERTSLKVNESNLINNLIEYVKSFNVQWSFQEAQAFLGNFLLDDGHAVDLFTVKTVTFPDRSEEVSPEWFVGKYVEKTITNRDCYFDYLMQLVKGLIIYIGVFESTSSHHQDNQKYRGTQFFLDTKLVLRYLGLSTQYAIQAVQEMISLIKEEYHGTIAVFKHTIDEVEAALNNAASCLKNGVPIRDDEMRAFAFQNNYEAEDFHIAVSNVRRRLEELQVFIATDDIQWNETETQKNNIDDNSLVEYISKRHLWHALSIQNDVKAINKINIMRKSNYTVAFGGKDRLPIFVTSNTALIFCLRSYVAENRGNEYLPNWTPNRLPVISDYLLTCQLWLPKAQTYQDFPLLSLCRDAQAAQQANYEFYQRLAAETVTLKEKHGVNIVDLDAARREKLEELAISRVGGDLSKVNDDVLAYSVTELVQLETQASTEVINKLTAEKEKMITEADEKDQVLIDSIAKRLWLEWHVLNWAALLARGIYWILIAIVVIIPQIILGVIDLSAMWPYMIACFITFAIIGDKVIDKYNIADKISVLIVEKVCNDLSDTSEQYLETKELPYLKQSIKCAFLKCPQLQWYRKKYPESFETILQKTRL